jgi:hypothetical protein
MSCWQKVGKLGAPMQQLLSWVKVLQRQEAHSKAHQTSQLS